MKELKLIGCDELKYIVEIPKRFSERTPSEIAIELFDGEYQYRPRKYTFMNNTRLAYDELEAIANKLRGLNGVPVRREK